MTDERHPSEGFALTGYVVPGCVEDGTWMLWENSSVAVVAIAVVARPGRGGAGTLGLFGIICPQEHMYCPN